MGIVALFPFIILASPPAELPLVFNGYSKQSSVSKEGNLSTFNEKRLALRFLEKLILFHVEVLLHDHTSLSQQSISNSQTISKNISRKSTYSLCPGITPWGTIEAAQVGAGCVTHLTPSLVHDVNKMHLLK